MTSAFLLAALAFFADGPTKKNAEPIEERPWHSGLKRTLAESLRTGKPILARAGAPWCGWCEKLAAEVRDVAVQRELERWTLCYVDADRDATDGRKLGVGPIPALRILTPEGRPVASRDGFLTAADLVAWLKEHHESAVVKPIDELLDTATPAGPGLMRLVRELEQRDPTLREAAIRRLIASPSTAAASVAKVVEDGSLQARISALEALREWNAPVADLDPWRPESFTKPKMEALAKWVKSVPTGPDPAAPTTLTAAERTAVASEIERMLAATDADVPGIRERAARYGKRAMPVVYEALKAADGDTAKQRLTALRYRLAASPSLAMHWRGGLDRLSAVENETRHRAAEELVERSGAAEEDLLLELFGDSDPFVRELALKGLHESAGGVQGALVKLLGDPNANVRAAVLKRLAENPSPAFIPKIKEFVKTEEDVDLVVHAVRVFRETKSKSSSEALLELFKHSNWRVRAEAVDAIAGTIGKRYDSDAAAAKAEVYEACLPLLEDPDPFVVGRAAGVLEGSGNPNDVPPLVKAVERHPALAASVLVALARNGSTSSKALPHFRRLAKSKEPLHRAGSIAALAATTEEFETEAKAGLVDQVASVRIAAMLAMFTDLEDLRKKRAASLATEASTGKIGEHFEKLEKYWREQPAGGEPAKKKATKTTKPTPPYEGPSASDAAKLLMDALLRPPSSLPPKSKSNEQKQPEKMSAPKSEDKKQPVSAPPPQKPGKEAEKVELKKSAMVRNDSFPGSIEAMVEQFWREQDSAKKQAPSKRVVASDPALEEQAIAIQKMMLETMKQGKQPDPQAMTELMMKMMEASVATPNSPPPVPAAPTKGKQKQVPNASGDSEYDEWLKKFRTGSKRPAWMLAEKASLEKSLAAADPEERLAAALVLNALGLSDAAIPTLLKAVAERPTLVARAAEALPWRVWPERLDLFRKLTTPIVPEHLLVIAKAMVEIRDSRAEDPLWALLDGDEDDERIAADVHQAMQELFFGEYAYSVDRIAASDKKSAAKSLAERVKAGPEWRRVTALALMAIADRDRADGVAEEWLKDKKTLPSLRRDAMQLRLLLNSKSDARKAAVEAAKSADFDTLEPALVYLALGRQELVSLRGAFHLYALSETETMESSRSEKGTIPEPPKGLTAEALRPLLDKATPKGAAVAGYFLVLLDDPAGLPPLIEYWRKSTPDASWAKLVYQAVSYLGEDRYVAALEDVYVRLKPPSLDAGDLYWTMRPMEGPRAKALRARIRKEVGMENLQQ